jgi:hydroxyacylglutathione hydrolase
MIFRQIIHDDLGCASYLVGDDDAGVAAVVVHIHRDASPDYPHDAIDDGWELALGMLRVRALHCPGHRPEHTCFALVDMARADVPWAVLTGDSMFVGDIARPDLAVEKADGARGLFRSLHGKLLALPDTCEVWPGHLGGSLCGGPGMDLKVSSTIGFERAHSTLLAIEDEDEFVERTIAGLAPQPPNFRGIVALNRGPLLAERQVLQPLDPGQVEAQRAAGALLVDVRTELQFDEAHIPGSVCITALRAGFGSKLAWIAEPSGSIVLVGRDDADAWRAGDLASAVGVTSVAGYLHGGMTAWREERRPVDRIARATVEQLHQRWSDGGVQILDARERDEWDGGHIPGSVHMPYHDLHELPDGIDAEQPVAAICASGQRASVAASLLKRHGAREVVHVVDGGVGTWRRAGWPIEH